MRHPVFVAPDGAFALARMGRSLDTRAISLPEEDREVF